MLMKVALSLSITMILVATEAAIFATEATIFDETKVAYVSGKVLCQDCTRSWKDWVNGDKPIKGAKVSVTCLDDRKRVSYYNSDETDAAGEFNIIINKDAYGKTLKPENCLVRLVSSTDPTCKVATNFGNGKTGVKLVQPNVKYRDIVKYQLSAFYYTSAACEVPSTSK